MSDAKIKSFTEYYHSQIKTAYIILVSLAILISLLDIATNSMMNTSILIVNLATIGILLITFVLHFVFKASLNIFATLGVYIIVLNLILSYLFSRPGSGDALNYLFRVTIFLLLILILSGLFLHKIHAIIILVFILVRYITVALIDKPPFLVENLPSFVLTFIALAIVIYFLSGRLHESIRDIQNNQAEIEKKNEDLFGKNESLQKMNTSKDQFFAMISHDLKNPLNALDGFIKLLSNKDHELSQERRDYYLKNIQDSIDRIMDLLNDLLEWSRSQSNKIEYNPNPFMIKDLVESVCYYLKQVAEFKGIELVNSARDDHIAYADFNMIFTVIRNLVSNAIKFSDQGTKIVIESEDSDDRIITRIVDHGVGMDDKTLAKLFRIDQTFSTPGTQNEKGTGLGLVLCKEFVEKNKGILRVESEAGKGSKFWFSLPKHFS